VSNREREVEGDGTYGLRLRHLGVRLGNGSRTAERLPTTATAVAGGLPLSARSNSERSKARLGLKAAQFGKTNAAWASGLYRGAGRWRIRQIAKKSEAAAISIDRVRAEHA